MLDIQKINVMGGYKETKNELIDHKLHISSWTDSFLVMIMIHVHKFIKDAIKRIDLTTFSEANS